MKNKYIHNYLTCLASLIFSVVGTYPAFSEPTSMQSTPIMTQIPRELSVVGEALVHFTTNKAELQLLVHRDGTSAMDASNKHTQVLSQLAKVANGKKFDTRDFQLAPISDRHGNESQSNESSSSRWRAQSQVTIELELESAAVAADAASKIEGVGVVAIEGFSDNMDIERSKGAELAVTRAKSQAEQLAKTLGIKLGEPLEVSVSEEPEEKSLRLKRQRGEDEEDETIGSEAKIYATVRFEITGSTR